MKKRSAPSVGSDSDGDSGSPSTMKATKDTDGGSVARGVAGASGAGASGAGASGAGASGAGAGAGAGPAAELPPTLACLSHAEPSARSALALIQAVARHPELSVDSCRKLKQAVLKLRGAVLEKDLRRSEGSKRKRAARGAPDRRLCAPTLFNEEPVRKHPHLYVPPPSSAMSAETAQDMVEQAAKRRSTIPVPSMTHDLDRYLEFVGNTYYQPSEAPASDDAASFGLIRRTTLGMLMSPLRPPSVLDRWTPREVALFESTICLIGKLFPQIQAVVKTKTVQECVEFYYVWKKSKNYAKWKETFRAE